LKVLAEVPAKAPVTETATVRSASVSFFIVCCFDQHRRFSRAVLRGY